MAESREAEKNSPPLPVPSSETPTTATNDNVVITAINDSKDREIKGSSIREGFVSHAVSFLKHPKGERSVYKPVASSCSIGVVKAPEVFDYREPMFDFHYQGLQIYLKLLPTDY